MYIRSALLGGLLTIILQLCLPLSAACAGETWHIGGGSGANSFATLEDFRLAVDGGLILGDGDVILLYKDDSSLTASLNLPDQWNLTLRSVGGRHTIMGDFTSILGPNNIIGIFGGNSPKLTVDNVHIDSTIHYSYGTIQVTSNNNDGELTISNSLITNNKQGANFSGGGTVNITNTTFTNNHVAALTVYNQPGESTTVNVNMNQNADWWTRWKGNAENDAVSAVEFVVHGEALLNFNISSGKVLDQYDPIVVTHSQYGAVQIEKNGGGVLKVAGGLVTADTSGVIRGSMDLVVNEGTVHFKAWDRNSEWYSPRQYDSVGALITPGGSVTFKSGTVFKPTLTPGNLEAYSNGQADTWTGTTHSILNIDRFIAEEGARLEIGGISLFPHLGTSEIRNGTREVYVGMTIAFLGSAGDSSIPSTMQINNKLLDAKLRFGDLDGTWGNADPADYDGMFIEINRLEDLSILDGVGSYADVYRKLNSLTDAERDMLDGIYARGGLSSDDRAYLQTLSGSIIGNSLLNMRHHWANLLRKINRRITDYQHEEMVEALDLGISGQGYANYYNPANPIVDYVNLWASIDQSWMYQNDSDSQAGYRFNTAGINIGADRHMENVIIGGVIRYDDGTMKLKSNKQTKTETQSVIGSFYGTWASEGMYVTGGLHAGYGWNDSWSNYRLPGGSITANTGNYASTMYGVHAETGYMYETELVDLPLRVTPYGGLAYAKMHRQATTESGGGNLDRHFRRNDWDMWEANLGIRLSMPINRGSYVLVPTADIGWSRTMGDWRNEHGDVNLLANPAAMWTNSTMAGNRSAFRGSAGLNAHFTRNMDIGANYEFEWRKKFWSHQLNLNFSIGF